MQHVFSGVGKVYSPCLRILGLKFAGWARQGEKGFCSVQKICESSRNICRVNSRKPKGIHTNVRVSQEIWGMFGCWPICGERVRVRDISGASVTYFVHENIDKGGFSTIELVSSSKSRQEFVLKRILCHSKSDEVKALDEAFLHLHLPQHRNILSCVGTGLTPLSHHPQGATSQVLMILKYYEKGTLERELTRRRKTADGLSSQIAAKLITGLCRALAVLLTLSSPLSHRDIKPANVLLGPNWCPVLMDFGSCTSAVIEIRNFKDAEKWKVCLLLVAPICLRISQRKIVQ
ncbi:unnamed protein product [Calicophoron daubneyi]|uniref:non-specific serine/threonine protein kinase n=1 Tax=Calicophoron daubneyi TaxID=300641 RepID=A0AAV2TCI0_CALDB